MSPVWCMICGMEHAVRIWTVIALLCVAVGTTMQAFLAMRELSEDTRAHLAFAVDDLRQEFPWWRPWKRRAQRALVKELLAESPVERAAYRRVKHSVNAWACMWIGSLSALAISVVSVVTS